MSQSTDLLERARPFVDDAVVRARRLPLFTLGIGAAMVFFFLAGIAFDIVGAFSLRPSNLWAFELSRLTTYPLAHVGLLHILLNMAAFVPLCGRFEQRHGTLRTLAMFLGPFESVPGILYCLLDGPILRHDTSIVGCSGWVFTLLAIESTLSPDKHVVIAGRRIPSWSVPLILTLAATLLLPGSSLLGHLCALGTGHVFGSGRVDFLLLPLGVCNFVERRIPLAVSSYVPQYVTAEQALKHGPQPWFGPVPTDIEAGTAPPAGQRLGGRPPMTRAATTSAGRVS